MTVQNTLYSSVPADQNSNTPDRTQGTSSLPDHAAKTKLVGSNLVGSPNSEINPRKRSVTQSNGDSKVGQLAKQLTLNIHSSGNGVSGFNYLIGANRESSSMSPRKDSKGDLKSPRESSPKSPRKDSKGDFKSPRGSPPQSPKSDSDLIKSPTLSSPQIKRSRTFSLKEPTSHKPKEKDFVLDLLSNMNLEVLGDIYLRISILENVSKKTFQHVLHLENDIEVLRQYSEDTNSTIKSIVEQLLKQANDLLLSLKDEDLNFDFKNKLIHAKTVVDISKLLDSPEVLTQVNHILSSTIKTLMQKIEKEQPSYEDFAEMIREIEFLHKCFMQIQKSENFFKRAQEDKDFMASKTQYENSLYYEGILPIIDQWRELEEAKYKAKKLKERRPLIFFQCLSKYGELETKRKERKTSSEIVKKILGSILLELMKLKSSMAKECLADLKDVKQKVIWSELPKMSVVKQLISNEIANAIFYNKPLEAFWEIARLMARIEQKTWASLCEDEAFQAVLDIFFEKYKDAINQSIKKMHEIEKGYKEAEVTCKASTDEEKFNTAFKMLLTYGKELYKIKQEIAIYENDLIGLSIPLPKYQEYGNMLKSVSNMVKKSFSSFEELTNTWDDYLWVLKKNLLFLHAASQESNPYNLSKQEKASLVVFLGQFEAHHQLVEQLQVEFLKITLQTSGAERTIRVSNFFHITHSTFKEYYENTQRLAQSSQTMNTMLKASIDKIVAWYWKDDQIKFRAQAHLFIGILQPSIASLEFPIYAVQRFLKFYLLLKDICKDGSDDVKKNLDALEALAQELNRFLPKD